MSTTIQAAAPSAAPAATSAASGQTTAPDPERPTPSPTPADYDPILRDLLNPSLSLADIAARFNTPILNLVAYVNSPFIQNALRSILDATKARAEMLAAAGIHAVVHTQYRAIEEAAALADQQPITPDTTPAQLSVRARMNDQARKAAVTLMRLAKPRATATRATNSSLPVKPQPHPRATGAQPSSHSAHTTERHPEPTALPQTVPRAA